MTNLAGANTTAQWYYDNYPGSLFRTIEKMLLHTTETKSWPGYSGGASAPNATYHPLLRQIRQHHPNERSARALRDPSNTAVRENRDNVFQLEIICYSDYNLARSVGGLWVGDLTAAHMEDIARMAIQLNRQMGLPLQSSVRWKEGQKTYVSGVRLPGPSYDAYRGILGHVHASGNSHWDPGGFRYSLLAAAIKRLSGGTTPPTTPPTTQPSLAGVADMFISEYGRTQGALFMGDRVQIITRAEFDRLKADGFPHIPLDNWSTQFVSAHSTNRRIPLRTDGEVKYSSAATTVDGIEVSTNYYTLVNLNRINKMTAKLDALLKQLSVAPWQYKGVDEPRDAYSFLRSTFRLLEALSQQFEDNGEIRQLLEEIRAEMDEADSPPAMEMREAQQQLEIEEASADDTEIEMPEGEEIPEPEGEAKEAPAQS